MKNETQYSIEVSTSICETATSVISATSTSSIWSIKNNFTKEEDHLHSQFVNYIMKPGQIRTHAFIVKTTKEHFKFSNIKNNLNFLKYRKSAVGTNDNLSAEINSSTK